MSVQRQLVSWREQLEDLGVHIHPLDDPAPWLGDGFHLADRAAPVTLTSAADRAQREGADVLLVSSERLEDSLRDPDRLLNLSSFAAEVAMPLTVLVVVRDQLGCLNHLYAERVDHLQMARDFASFSADPSPSERFDFGSAFRLPMTAPDIAFTAVPYSDLRPGAEARALLAAAGVPDDDVATLPETGAPARALLPGPVLLAAKRLLFKRLWRLGLVASTPRPRLMQSGRGLAALAVQQGWDSHPFGGWDERARETATARYGPGNDAFDMAVWGRPWGDDWETGQFHEVDLPSLPPTQVVDILGAVEAIVQELQAAKASVESH
jgi:hypothetical protein